MYFLNPNGKFQRRQGNGWDEDLNDNVQTRNGGSKNTIYPQPTYPMKQFIDEHITDEIWYSNGIDGTKNTEDWQDGFSASMKSSKWDYQGLNNRKGIKWRDYTQRGNPWV